MPTIKFTDLHSLSWAYRRLMEPWHAQVNKAVYTLLSTLKAYQTVGIW